MLSVDFRIRIRRALLPSKEFVLVSQAIKLCAHLAKGALVRTGKKVWGAVAIHIHAEGDQWG